MCFGFTDNTEGVRSDRHGRNRNDGYDKEKENALKLPMSQLHLIGGRGDLMMIVFSFFVHLEI